MELDFAPIDPPPEFQDSPGHCSPAVEIEKFAAKLVTMVLADALSVSCKVTWSIPCSHICHMSDSLPLPGPRSGRWTGLRLCWTPELVAYSPCHGNRPASRSSLSSSRLSSSHNSLTVPGANKVDDSSFITSAMSHDVLSDMYNVPFDSDMYAVPVDVVTTPRPPARAKRRHHRRRRHQSCEPASHHEQYSVPVGRISSHRQAEVASDCGKRHSTPGGSGDSGSGPRSASAGCSSEPIHLTLHEVRQYLHTLYSSSSDSSDNRNLQETFKRLSNPFRAFSNNIETENVPTNNNNYYCKKNRKNALMKMKKAKEPCEGGGKDVNKWDGKKSSSGRISFSTNIKQTLCNMFRWKKLPTPDQCLGKREVVHTAHSDEIGVRLSCHVGIDPPSPITKPPFSKRALPPLPRHQTCHQTCQETPLLPEDGPPKQDIEQSMDFASSIEKVKDYGWYWGPISGEAAEKILSNEPDGSFIVRDSSDDYYIFSLTFKLNSIVRHVRIEHDQGSFSFGSSTRFKSHTIVDFIESAVEHSRSGRYLFFLHRRPVLGPMRVQLLHPVSRFKQVQSLQHMCRFVILKLVRRDLIPELPLPRRLLDYLSTPHYYTEQVVEDESAEAEQLDS